MRGDIYSIVEEMRQLEKGPVVVLVPYPAQGHVTPMLRLARALRARGFRPVLVLPDFIHRRLVGSTGDGSVAFEPLFSGLDGGGANRDFFAIDEAMENCMPAHLERLLERMHEEGGERVACVVVDLLASWAVGVAAKCGVPAAGFWPAMLATYRIIAAVPELIEKGFISEFGTPLDKQQSHSPSLTFLEQELSLPSQARLSTKDLPWLVGNSSSQRSRFMFWLRVLQRTMTLPWLLINSFNHEGATTLDDQHQPVSLDHGPRTFLVAPLLQANNNNNGNCNKSTCQASMWDEDMSCLEWLDQQQPGSVIYISFGSWVGPIGPEKVAELALGLEATRRAFLWVVKDEESWLAGVPAGFSDRVAGRGKMVAWAPQEEVLKHHAVGCFMTHCGWNSTLEAVRHGRRLLCYPISGDQFVNCAYIARVWGIGLEPNGYGRVEIYDCIERVMESEEGMEIHRRVLKLSRSVMGVEGSSRAAADLQQFIDAVKKLDPYS